MTREERIKIIKEALVSPPSWEITHFVLTGLENAEGVEIPEYVSRYSDELLSIIFLTVRGYMSDEPGVYLEAEKWFNERGVYA